MSEEIMEAQDSVSATEEVEELESEEGTGEESEEGAE